jgi:transposase
MVTNRVYRWRQAGVWQRVFAVLLQVAGRSGWLDWTMHFLDSTSGRAHPHAAGARAGQEEVVGCNRVERLVPRFKQFRRVATPFEKHAVNYLAMVALAAVTMWL